ncbi:hypothetical protein AX14_003690, partial [Amanita brunnescens Koide BX004]
RWGCSPRSSQFVRPALEPGVLGINSVENGIFLNKILHGLFRQGRAFLKTPNFALDPADIPRVEAGPMPSSRITLHNLAPDTSLDPIPQRDAPIVGMGISPLSTVILDYMYGVAAYQCWGSGQDIEESLRTQVTEIVFQNLMIPTAAIIYPIDNRGRNHSTKTWMDKVLALSMLLKGTTPELMTAERQRREEAEELRAKEASCVRRRLVE